MSNFQSQLPYLSGSIAILIFSDTVTIYNVCFSYNSGLNPNNKSEVLWKLSFEPFMIS